MSTATKSTSGFKVRPPNHYRNLSGVGLKGSAPMELRKWYMDVSRGRLREVEASYTYENGEWKVTPIGDKQHDSYAMVTYDQACKIHEISFRDQKTIFAAFLEFFKSPNRYPPEWVERGAKADKHYSLSAESDEQEGVGSL